MAPLKTAFSLLKRGRQINQRSVFSEHLGLRHNRFPVSELNWSLLIPLVLWNFSHLKMQVEYVWQGFRYFIVHLFAFVSSFKVCFSWAIPLLHFVKLLRKYKFVLKSFSFNLPLVKSFLRVLYLMGAKAEIHLMPETFHLASQIDIFSLKKRKKEKK